MVEPKSPEAEPKPRDPEVLEPRFPLESVKPLPPPPGMPLLLAPTLLSWKPGRSEARLPLPVPPPKMLLRVFASSMASTFCRR